jgi:hypothetical protein
MKLASICLGILVGLAATQSFAARKYGMAGCGLGSVLMGPKGSQILALTTNGSSANQSFGISFGTLNCVHDTEAAAYQEQEIFVTQNLTVLSKEMAQGKGESLDALASTLGCDTLDRPEVARQLQTSFSKIFQAPGAIAVLEATVEELKSHPTLSKTCKYLG